MHHLLGTALLIFVTSSVSRACIPTKTPHPGIPATPGTPSPCKNCPAPSPTLAESAADGNMPFATKAIDCNKFTFVCTGSAIELNDATQVGDAGDGTPDGKVTVELNCSGDQTTWQYEGVGVITKIACFQ